MCAPSGKSSGNSAKPCTSAHPPGKRANSTGRLSMVVMTCTRTPKKYRFLLVITPRYASLSKAARRQSIPPDADIVAQWNGKRIQPIPTFIIEVFESCFQLMKKPINQIRQPRQTSRKARPTQRVGKNLCFFNLVQRFLIVAAIIKHRNQSRGQNLSIIYLLAFIFLMIHHLEQIIQKAVYCSSALAHFESSPLFLSSNKILGEDFYFSNISN